MTINPFILHGEEVTPVRKLLYLKAFAGGGALSEYELTGNPVAFNTNVAKPLSAFTIPFLPIQSGTGDPSPSNVRPISGWSGANIWRTGANVFNAEAWIALGVNGTKYGIGENCTVTVKENDTSGISNRLISLVPGAEYSFYKDSNFSDLRIFNSSGSSIGRADQSFTCPNDGKVAVKFYASTYPTTGQFALVAGSIPPATCVPYTGQSYPVTFPALGKNLFDIDELWDNGTNYGSGEVSKYYKLKVPNGKYTVSTDVINNTNQAVASVFVTDRLETPTSSYNGVFLNTPRTITITNEELYIFIRVSSSGGYLAWDKTTFSEYFVQVESGSTATAYEPYTNTVYGGTLDAVNGVLTVEWAYANLNSESAWGSYGTGDGFLVYVTKSDMKVGNRLPGYCDMFPSTFSQTGANIRFGANDNVIRLYNINTLGIADLSEWKEFIGTDGINICYLLATPYEIPLSDIPVPVTLIGDNTIWTDTNGENTVKYLKKG